MKKVGVVILNYNAAEETTECVKSVKASTYTNVVVIVVSNSQDDLSEVTDKYKDIIFIQNNENLGYSGGNNIGIKNALKEGVDYVFILNADTVIDKNAISVLVQVADKGEGDILGPKILFKKTGKIWFAGGIFDKANVIGSHRGVDEVDSGQYEGVEETEYVSGGAIFIKREVLESIGFFDEKYFLYYEDSDFCFRAKKAGFKIVYVPQALVYHENAKSTGLGSPLQDYYITRNRMFFASKFLPFRTRFALFREALRNIGNPVRRQAFFDFQMGKLGKGDI